MGKKKSYLINSLIVVALMFGVRFVPAPDFLTREGFDVLGLLIGSLWGWSTVGTIWPSLLCLIGLGFVGDNTVPALFREGFGSSTFVLVFMFTVFAGIIDQSGLGRVISSRMLRSRGARKSPWGLTMLLLLVAYCTAFVISVVPGIVLTWTVLNGICWKCGFEKSDLWPKLMVVGIVFACCMGHSAWPIEALAFTLVDIYREQVGSPINYVPFTILNVTIGLLSLVLYALVCRFLLKVDVRKLSGKDLQIEGADSLTTYQKQMGMLVLVFFLVLFVPGAFPEAGGIVGVLNDIGAGGSAALVIAFAVMLRRKSGEPFVDIQKAIREGVPWGALFLIAAAMPLASALSSPEAGLSTLFQQTLGQMLGGVGSATLFTALFIVSIVLLTNVVGNMTVGIVMVPVACLFAPVVGANPALLTTVACIACNAALVLPSGGPTAAILHGNMEWFEGRGEITRYGLIAATVFCIAAVGVSLSLGALLF